MDKIKEAKPEEKQFFKIPVLLYNHGPSLINKTSLEVMTRLVDLGEKLELSSYTIEEIQGVAGIFISDGISKTYSFHEIILKVLNYFPNKSDILRLEEKINKINLSDNTEALRDRITYLEEKISILNKNK